MLAFFREWLINISVIGIMGVVADLILPGGNMKKYTRFLIGVIMLTIMLKPIFHIFNRVEDLSNLAARNLVLMDLSGLNYHMKLYDSKQQEEIRNSFKKSLELHMAEQIRSQTGYRDVNVMVNLSEVDESDERVTGIESVYVEIGNAAKGSIRPVRIKIDAGHDADRSNDSTGEEQRIKGLIAGIYGLSLDKIRVRCRTADEARLYPGEE